MCKCWEDLVGSEVLNTRKYSVDFFNYRPHCEYGFRVQYKESRDAPQIIRFYFFPICGIKLDNSSEKEGQTNV